MTKWLLKRKCIEIAFHQDNRTYIVSGVINILYISKNESHITEVVIFKNISILPFCNEIYYMCVDWVLMWSLTVSFVDIKNEIRIKFVNRVTIFFVTTLLYIKFLKRFESSYWRHPLKNFWIRPCWLFNLHSLLQQSAFMRVSWYARSKMKLFKN